MNVKKREKIYNRLLNACLIILVLVIGLAIGPVFLGRLNEDYRNTFYGFRPYVVVSGSMEPNIMQGALLIGRVTDFSRLEERDVITFLQAHDELNTHRIIEVHEFHVVTQGDNNDFPDHMPVTAENFQYRVIFVWNGASALNTPRGLLLYVALPVVGLMVFVSVIVLLTNARRRRKAKQDQPVYTGLTGIMEQAIDEAFEEDDNDIDDVLNLVTVALRR